MPRPFRRRTLARLLLVLATPLLFTTQACSDDEPYPNVIGVRVENGLSNAIDVKAYVPSTEDQVQSELASSDVLVDVLAGEAGDEVTFTATDNAGVYALAVHVCVSTSGITAPVTGTPQNYGQANVLPGAAAGQPLVIQCSSGWEVND
jgi:hypothetical protein